MNFHIVRQVSELEKKIWNFYLTVDFIRLQVHLQSYEKENRPTKRHKFRKREHWTSWDPAHNSIKEPPKVPLDVKAELRTQLKEMIDQVEIK